MPASEAFRSDSPASRRSQRPWLLLLVVLLLSLTTAAAARGADLKVVASFSILADLVRQVGGERIRLTTLVGVNGDAHVYEPTPADAAAVAAADIVFVNGLHFEGFVPRLLAASGTRAPVVELSQGAALLDEAGRPIDGSAEARHSPDDEDDVQDQDGHDHGDDDHGDYDHGDHDHGDHDHGGREHDAHDHAGEPQASHGPAGQDPHRHDHGPINPHAWQSVANARVYVANLAAAFCRIDPSDCEGYRSRAKGYDDALAAVDRDVRAILDAIPADRRTVITSHDAFGYFGHAYRLRFLAPRGLSTEAEASARDMVTLIRQLRASRASALFVENVGDPRLVEQLARETGLRVGGVLYPDSLSDRSGPASTYVEMMRHNARTLAGAILSAPAGSGPR